MSLADISTPDEGPHDPGVPPLDEGSAVKRVAIGFGSEASTRTFLPRVFSFIMFLFTLTETEGEQKAPVITLPAG
jgi:hypothetical protein